MRKLGTLALVAGLAVALADQAAAGATTPLHRAVAENQVQVDAQALGYSSARLTLINRGTEPLAVEILGSYLEPVRGEQVDPGIQPLALAFTTTDDRARAVILEPSKPWTATFRSFCMKQRASAPSERTRMRVARTAVPKLVERLLDYWHARKAIGQSSVQDAVWTVMALPEKVRDTVAGEKMALAQMKASRDELVRHLMAGIDMAVGPRGELFFGKGSLADLRELGVDVPEIGDSLLVALPSRETDVKLTPTVGADGAPLDLRRYHPVAGHLFATTATGLVRYDTSSKRWLADGAAREVRKIVGSADGPLYLLTQGDLLFEKRTPDKGEWVPLGGPFADVVVAPRIGLLALRRRDRAFFRLLGEGKQRQWKRALPASPLERHHATAGELYRHSPTTGALSRWTGKRWAMVAARGVREVWAGATHLWYADDDGALWVAWDEAGAPRRIEERLGQYYVARVRHGVDQLYVKTRAHLVIVYDPKHDQ